MAGIESSDLIGHQARVKNISDWSSAAGYISLFVECWRFLITEVLDDFRVCFFCVCGIYRR